MIKDLNELASWGDLTQDEIWYHRYEIDYPFFKRYGIEIVAESEYPKEVYEMIGDSYYAIPYFMVIKYKDYYYKTECDMGSYVEEWSPWKEVTEREKLITYYE